MKRVRLLVLLGAIAIALPFGFSTVGAAGSSAATSTSSSISIQPKAQYDDAGIFIHVGMWVRCSGGLGVVQVQVDQYPPHTTTETHGFGGEDVVCDGRTHEAGVTITGVRYDAGPAKATATLIPPVGGSKSVTTSKWITITVQRG